MSGTGMFPLVTFVQHCTGGLPRTISWEREIKDIQIGKEKVKLSLFTDSMTLNAENSKDSTKELLEIRNEFNEVVGYKNIHNLYTNNELCKREIKIISSRPVSIYL